MYDPILFGEIASPNVFEADSQPLHAAPSLARSDPPGTRAEDHVRGLGRC
jgi:hypothetical protein